MRFLSAFALALFLSCCCQIPPDPVITSLGEPETYVHYTSGEFQDFTDYGKYDYLSVDIAENPYFHQILENDLSTIHALLDDFESMVSTIARDDPLDEVCMNYDFDRAIIDTHDFICIEAQTHTWNSGHTAFTNYDIYFFDTQTQTLYYFHNNI